MDSAPRSHEVVTAVRIETMYVDHTHEDQKGLIDRLEQSGLLDPDHLLKTTTYTGGQEADIEDVIGREMYVFLVNESLGLSGELRLPESKPVDADARVVKEAEAHNRTLPANVREYSHYLPIEYLLGMSNDEIAEILGLARALDRFEQLFRDLNQLIETS